MFDPFFRWVESTTVGVWINRSPSLFAFPGILAATIICGRMITFYRPNVRQLGQAVGFLANCIVR